MGMKKAAFQIVFPEFFIPARKARGSPGTTAWQAQKSPGIKPVHCVPVIRKGQNRYSRSPSILSDSRIDSVNDLSIPENGDQATALRDNDPYCLGDLGYSGD